MLEALQRQHGLVDIIDNGLSALLLTHHSSLSRLSFLSLPEYCAVEGLPSPWSADGWLLKLGEWVKKSVVGVACSSSKYTVLSGIAWLMKEILQSVDGISF